MIARGDLAVELSFERLAEMQEELLWFGEACHLPVIWATQVLDTLAHSGVPTRAEVTDAAMSMRAECVMLNKGPYIAEAARMLADIIRKMEAHQYKKRSLYRPLALAAAEIGTQRAGTQALGRSAHCDASDGVEAAAQASCTRHPARHVARTQALESSSRALRHERSSRQRSAGAPRATRRGAPPGSSRGPRKRASARSGVSRSPSQSLAAAREARHRGADRAPGVGEPKGASLPPASRTPAASQPRPR